MRVERGASRRRGLFGLTPLIDVVFILLLFFMLSSSFVQWRALTLATGGEGTAVDAGPARLLGIAADGRLDLDGIPVSLAELPGRLGPGPASEAGPAVLVRPHPDVPLQVLVGVFERLAFAGVRRPTLAAP